jgi:hypothetical protein
MDTGLRIALSTGFFGRDLTLGVAARSVCRSWREAVRGHVAPELEWHPRFSKRPYGRSAIHLSNVPVWCACFPQAGGMDCHTGWDNDAESARSAAAALAGMRQLRRLVLHVNVKDAEIQLCLLAAVPSALTHLRLKLGYQVVPPAWALTTLLWRLTGLQHFGVSLTLSAELVAALPPTLVGLRATAGIANNASLAHLPLLRDLQTPHGLRAVGPLATVTPLLRSLKMDTCDDNRLLTRFTSLRHLTCEMDLSIAEIAALPPTLEELHMGVPLFDATGGPSLAHLTRLQSLWLSLGDAIGDFDDLGFADIARTMPPSLRELDLFRFPVDEHASLAHLPVLEHVHLTFTSVFDSFVASLPPSVADLDMQLCEGPTSACSFAHLPRLQRLKVHPRVLAADGAAVASLSPDARHAWLAAAIRAGSGGGISVQPLRKLSLEREDGELDDERGLEPLAPPAFEHLASVRVLKARSCDLSGWDLSPLTQLRKLSFRFVRNTSAAIASAPPSLRILCTDGAHDVQHWPPSVTDLTVYDPHPDGLLRPPPGLRVATLQFESQPGNRVRADWSSTPLELLIVDSFSAVHTDATFFTTLPPTLRVLSCSNMHLLPPPHADQGATDATSGSGAGDPSPPLQLDLTHLTALYSVYVAFAKGHPSVTVTAQGRTWEAGLRELE